MGLRTFPIQEAAVYKEAVNYLKLIASKPCPLSFRH